MDVWRFVDDYGREHLGCITRAGLMAAGMSPRSISATAKRRGWRRFGDGVYALPGTTWSYEQEVMAACLRVGSGALAARQTACYLWGLRERPPRPIEIVVPALRTPRARAGMQVLRSRTLSARDATAVSRVPATRVSRTLCDVAAVVEVDELVELTARAIQRRMVTLDAVSIRASTMGPFEGAGRLREAVGQLRGRRTDSQLEREVRTVLIAHGLIPHPEIFPLRRNGKVVARLDIAFLAERVAVEVDGLAFHGTPGQQTDDHDRNLLLAEFEFLPVAVGQRKIRRGPEDFCRRLLTVLERRARLAFTVALER